MHMGVAQQADDFNSRDALAGMLPELRAFARLLAGSRAEADDLVQEALLRMLRAPDGFRPGANPEAELRAWAREQGILPDGPDAADGAGEADGPDGKGGQGVLSGETGAGGDDA